MNPFTRAARPAKLAGAAALAAVALGGVLVGRDLLEPAVHPGEVLDTYCVDCHDNVEFAGGVAFDTSELDDLHADAELWERAVRKVRTGFMPPAGAPRPERGVLDGFAAALEAELDRAAEVSPNPGMEGVSRLNRAEYANAVRDLLAYDASDVVATLPADDAIGGFDNIANALTVSPTLVESYVSAAVKISRAAVGDVSMGPRQVSYEAPAGLSQDRHVDGLPLGTRGGMRFTHNFPLDAAYELRIAARGRGPLSGQRFCELPEIDVTVNGERLDVRDPGAFRLNVPAGPQTITVALLDQRRCAGVGELYGVYAPGGGIQHVEIHGPFDPAGAGDTPSRRAIFQCFPERSEDEAPCARLILTHLASRAFRRPLETEAREVETLMSFYERGRRVAGFESGIQRALSRLLVDPRFLYRLEPVPEGVAPGAAYRIDDVALASRLSFFLWSSIPDAALLEAAADGRLSQPAELERQVRRMLADERAAALVENFAGQWLKLRDLDAALPQDRDFDANLRAAFRQETELLFASLIREDRSVLNLLDADYTYLNERLARHYGVPGVRGSYMRRVALAAESPRRGLLGHGSILTVTSVANRTSPVIRGQWIVENLLGAEVPPPPPGVEADLSAASAAAADATTLRERMERHRRDPDCAACHALIDPFGFALENFDLVGRWRGSEAGQPLDTRVELVDGTIVDGPAQLRQALGARSSAFATAMTEKLMTYALGRIVEHDDMPAVRRVVARAAREDYRFSAFVLGIVDSTPFRMKRRPIESQTSGESVARR